MKDYWGKAIINFAMLATLLALEVFLTLGAGSVLGAEAPGLMWIIPRAVLMVAAIFFATFFYKRKKGALWPAVLFMIGLLGYISLAQSAGIVSFTEVLIVVSTLWYIRKISKYDTTPEEEQHREKQPQQTYDHFPQKYWTIAATTYTILAIIQIISLPFLWFAISMFADSLIEGYSLIAIFLLWVVLLFRAARLFKQRKIHAIYLSYALIAIWMAILSSLHYRGHEIGLSPLFFIVAVAVLFVTYKAQMEYKSAKELAYK